MVYLNGHHLNIKFTCEIKEENSLPVLDVLVLVYRAFHIYLTYMSFHKQLLSIKEVFHDNCYPEHLIDGFINRF